MTRTLALLPALATVIGLMGCAPDTYFPPTDFERAGTWQADGVNDRNLRAMVADPSHLTRGVGAATDRGGAGAAAVAALDCGRRPPLPTLTLSEIGEGERAQRTGVTTGGPDDIGRSAGCGGSGGGGGGGSGAR